MSHHRHIKDIDQYTNGITSVFVRFVRLENDGNFDDEGTFDIQKGFSEEDVIRTVQDQYKAEIEVVEFY